MKVLRINNNKAEFLSDKDGYRPIKDIGKDDIYYLLSLIYQSDSTEIDTNVADLPDPAERIIYNSLSEHFNSFISNKSTLATEIDDVVGESKRKYYKE